MNTTNTSTPCSADCEIRGLVSSLLAGMLLTILRLFLRGDIDLIDRLDEELQVLKMESANNILPPSVDVVPFSWSRPRYT